MHCFVAFQARIISLTSLPTTLLTSQIRELLSVTTTGLVFALRVTNNLLLSCYGFEDAKLCLLLLEPALTKRFPSTHPFPAATPYLV